MTVLNWDAVDRMRREWEGGVTQSALSVRYQVSLNTVAKIVKGQSWVRREGVRVAGGGPREEDPDAILARALALQAEVNARNGPPPSLLDGGDVEGVEGGLARLAMFTPERVA